MESNNPYIMARKTLEGYEKFNGTITVRDAMDVLYQVVELVTGQLYNAVRNQAAIAAMQGMLSNPALVDDGYDYRVTIEKAAVCYADSLIEELKKK